MANEIVTIDAVQVRTDSFGRYCLNDLHRAAMAAGTATDNHRPSQFLRNDSVQDFVSALDAEKTGEVQKCTSVHTVKGGLKQGVYADELVAIRYAAWIDPRFEVRVYREFRRAVAAGNDWRKLRHAAASTTKVANDLLKLIREANGKPTEPKHYMNEAKMVNWALAGKFEGLDRDGLCQDDLDLLAHLQERNAVLIGRGLGYEERKPMIKQYAMDWKLDRAMLLT